LLKFYQNIKIYMYWWRR